MTFVWHLLKITTNLLIDIFNLILILLTTCSLYAIGSFLLKKRIATNSIKVIGVMSRCNKVHSYSCKQSICTKCVSEILEHRLTIKKEFRWHIWCGFIIVKSLGKYEQRCNSTCNYSSFLLLTRPPMKRSDRPTVSTYIGVIIYFETMGLLHLIYFSSLPLVSALPNFK